MALPLALLFSPFTIALLDYGGGGALHFCDCHIAFYHCGLQFWGAAVGSGGFLFLQFFIPLIPALFFLSPPFCPPSPSLSLSLCIIYSHFLAIKMERCCRIFACSATLQCWWIILHPANWKASLSFMSALCWFTIKTYCTVLRVEDPALWELAKSKNEDEADTSTCARGSFSTA